MSYNLSSLERGYELHFALHQELVFKTFAKRNHLFAQWAADLLDLPADKKIEYVRDVMDFVFGDKDSTRLIGRVYEDLRRHGVHLTVVWLRSKLYECEGAACRAIVESLVGDAVVPVAPQRSSGVKDVMHAAAVKTITGVQAVERALAHAKEDLHPKKTLQFRDMFLNLVQPEM